MTQDEKWIARYNEVKDFIGGNGGTGFTEKLS